jgi:DNA-binding Lrp family transcriptional regulator
MVRAYILVETASEQTQPLVEAVRKQEHVAEAHVVAGDFDIIAETEAPEVSDILRSAANGIRALEGVEDTRTYVCLE